MRDHDPGSRHRERDLDTLRTILNYRGFRADNDEKRIDFGVLGEVAVPGQITVGDEVRVLARASDSPFATSATS